MARVAAAETNNEALNKERNDAVGADIFYPITCWSELKKLDKTFLAKQNAGRRFDISVIRAIAKRCSHGFPQVIVCHPFAGKEPFPTTFWLTCPYLDRKCGELESHQQISRLEEVFAVRSECVLMWHLEYAALRKSLLAPLDMQEIAANNPGCIKAVLDYGVGGINYRESPQAVKCLHLQTAAWLGMGHHPASDWLEEKLDELECRRISCRKFVD